MYDQVKQLDRIQKRAKSWVRKWYGSEKDPRGDKLIEKLRALLENEVEPLGAEALAQGEARLKKYKGAKTRLYDSAKRYVKTLRELMQQNLPAAIDDPRAYAESSNITYGSGGPENTVEHLVTLAEGVYLAARSAESTTTSLLRKRNASTTPPDDYYLCEACAYFAIALHRLYGYPLRILWDDAVQQVWAPGVTLPTLVHVFVEDRSTGEAIDVRGRRSVSDMVEQYLVEEPRTEAVTLDELLVYMGDGAPLYGFDEREVQEAVELIQQDPTRYSNPRKLKSKLLR